VEFDWDLADRFVAVRDSLGDETLHIRDERGRIERISDLGRDYGFRYLPTGEVTAIEYPNGLQQLFEYDAVGRMIHRRMVSRSGETVTWRRFRYDAASQLIEMEDWRWGLFGYEYDGRGRLVAVRAADPALSESYAYDETSNLVSCPLMGRTFIETGNRVRSAGDARFEYEADGNLVRAQDEAGAWEYQWDRDGQLASVQRDGVTLGEYEYDLLNGRVGKRTSAGRVGFIHAFNALRAEVFADGSRNHYLSLADMPVPIAQARGDDHYYYGYDQVGTPIEVFNEAGELVLAVRAQAYGGGRQEHRPTNDDVALPFGFMGQYRDEESGLFYNQFRYYDPKLGRYISQDPLGILAGLNFYIYPTNPNNVVDPLGLMPTLQCLSHWSPCAQRYVKEKVARMNSFQRKGKLKKTCTTCRKDRQRDDFKSKRCGGGKTGNPAGASRQVDHIVELQCGGHDRCCNNLASIPAGFNNDLGKQVKAMLSKHKVGDRIGRITTSGCNPNPPCGDAAYKRYVRLPKEKDDCKGPHQKPVKKPPC
jgi:RHS repeat-associated protein